MGRVKMVTQDCSDRNRVTWLPEGVAWVAARAIARETHYAVILYGRYGTARFDQSGNTTVEWSTESTIPGQVEHYEDGTTVCIN